MNYNEILYNTTKKTINDYGQDIGWTELSGSEYAPTKFFKGVVKYKKQLLESTNYYMILKDEFEFILLDKVEIDDYLVWNNAKYRVVSIDNTIPNLYKCYGQFKTIMSTDEYTIQCDDISIDMGSSIQLLPVCMKNGAQESNPTITYISGNSSIATCSDNGLVEGVSSGSTTITLEWQGVTKTINVIVGVTATYTISGNTKLIKDKQTTYTISPDLPTDNYSWELDEMSVEVELAEIVNSNQSQCILTTTCGDGETVTLSAKANGVVVASIDLTCTRK